MENLCFHSLNIHPKLRVRSGETSKSGDDKRVSLAHKPLPFQINNAWQTRLIFLQKKFFQMPQRWASLFIPLEIFLIARRNTSIANPRKELPVSIIWWVNIKCWVMNYCHASDRAFRLHHAAQYFLHPQWKFECTLYARFVSRKSELISKAMLQTNKTSKNIA